MQAAEKIRHYVEEKAGDPVIDLRPFSSGNNSSLYLVDLKEGKRFVVKAASRPNARLDLEGWMLGYLRKHSRLSVPEVVCAEPDMLVMTYLSNAGVLDTRAQAHAADLLADLHNITAREYGLERDTLIGPLEQPNILEKDWLTFFREHRLLYMAKEALIENRIDGVLMEKIEKLAGKLDNYIDDPAPPSLLHGDVWGGNVLSAPGKITGFIDPAIYYGDPEIELAFSTLFGTFGDSFFKRYNEHHPIRDGFFEVRKDLYNLYPLLVHTRLFGRSYADSVKRIVTRLV